MSDTTLPKPLSAYVGFVLASLEEARSAGESTVGQVARLPFAAASQLISARHRYDEFAEQGDAAVSIVVGIVRGRLGAGDDEASDWIGDDLSSARGRASVARAMTTDVAEQVAWAITGVAGRAASTVSSFTAGRSHTPNGVLKDLADTLEVTADRLTDKAEELEASLERQAAFDLVEAEASAAEAVVTEPTPMQKIEQFSVPEEIGVQAGGLKSAADLPLDDFDHMTGPQLRGRLRTLDRVQLVQLLDYERAHADRVGIVLMLENRLTKLIAADQ